MTTTTTTMTIIRMRISPPRAPTRIGHGNDVSEDRVVYDVGLTVVSRYLVH